MYEYTMSNQPSSNHANGSGVLDDHSNGHGRTTEVIHRLGHSHAGFNENGNGQFANHNNGACDDVEAKTIGFGNRTHSYTV